MHREDDLIFFDEIDQRNYPALADTPFVPIEAVPGLLEDILEAKEANAAEVQRYKSRHSRGRSVTEYIAGLQPIYVQAIRLEKVASGLGELAGTELIESMLTAEL